MWDFSIGQAFGHMGRTLPFIVFRIVVYAGTAVAYVLMTGIGAGVGWGVGAFGDGEFQASTTLWGALIGFGLTAGVLYILREYILYIVKPGHIAVLVKLLDGEDVPDGQNQIGRAAQVLKNAAWLTVVTYGPAFLVFLVMLAPAATVAWVIPGGWSAAGLVFALIFAWAVKAALIEPFAIACMMQVFFRTTAGQAPDPEWDSRISGVSRRFNELKERAVHWVGGRATPGDVGTSAN
ncbi:MAG: hypothetical protein JWQ89_3927 [Devosia sp.]|uniref:hypothetical protein n=1 Tax=Devosia sp. TaxID=1871048 RepID=UPI0026251DD0|nr:hypothetical protein [Devosia sp.]MDB5542200.1 hypothetical protein [Devosia sp.]